MVFFLVFWSDPKKIIDFPTCLTSISDHRSLYHKTRHQFLGLTIPYWCTVIIICRISTGNIESARNGINIEWMSCFKKSNFDRVRLQRYKWFKGGTWINSKSITFCRICKKIVEWINILFWKWIIRYDHSTFLTKSDIISSLFMHICKNSIIWTIKVNDSRMWLDKFLPKSLFHVFLLEEYIFNLSSEWFKREKNQSMLERPRL